MTATLDRRSRIRRGAASVAIAFGVLTLLAGGRILLGVGQAGYAVWRPVLVFNTAMGAAYVGVGVGLWRAARWARAASVAIALANLAMLLLLGIRRSGGGTVANETLAAMTLRTLVWIAIATIATRDGRRGALERTTAR